MHATCERVRTAALQRDAVESSLPTRNIPFSIFNWRGYFLSETGMVRKEVALSVLSWLPEKWTQLGQNADHTACAPQQGLPSTVNHIRIANSHVHTGNK